MFAMDILLIFKHNSAPGCIARARACARAMRPGALRARIYRVVRLYRCLGRIFCQVLGITVHLVALLVRACARARAMRQGTLLYYNYYARVLLYFCTCARA